MRSVLPAVLSIAVGTARNALSTKRGTSHEKQRRHEGKGNDESTNHANGVDNAEVPHGYDGARSDGGEAGGGRQGAHDDRCADLSKRLEDDVPVALWCQVLGGTHAIVVVIEDMNDVGASNGDEEDGNYGRDHREVDVEEGHHPERPYGADQHGDNGKHHAPEITEREKQREKHDDGHHRDEIEEIAEHVLLEQHGNDGVARHVEVEAGVVVPGDDLRGIGVELLPFGGLGVFHEGDENLRGTKIG